MKQDIFNIMASRLDDENSEVIILDQTSLPNEVRYKHHKTKESVWEAINHLEVRGAPAIGIAAAYGLYIAIKGSCMKNFTRNFLRQRIFCPPQGQQQSIFFGR